MKTQANRFASIASVALLSTACALFSPPPPEPTEQEKLASERAALDAEVKALDAEVKALNTRCFSETDDAACAAMFDHPARGTNVHNQAVAQFNSGDQRMLAFAGRGCTAGSARACRTQQQLVAIAAAQENLDRFQASLGIVTREEIKQVQPGWSLEQVETTLGQACALTLRSVSHDPYAKRDVETSTYTCYNADSSGLYLILVDGTVRNMTVMGAPPE